MLYVLTVDSRLVAGIIANTVYGIEIEEMNHEYVRLVTQARDVMDTIKHPGNFWLEYMPFLRYVPTWVPGASGVKYAARVRPTVEAMVNKPFDTIKDEIVSHINSARALSDIMPIMLLRARRNPLHLI